MIAGEKNVIVEREYALPVASVFRAWTDPAILCKWFGCGPGQLWTIHCWEPQVGGKIHVSMVFDGTPYNVRGEFIDVEANARLRYTWDDDQIVDVRFVEVRLVEEGAKSKVIVHHQGLQTPEIQGMVFGGWSFGLSQIDNLSFDR